MGGMYLHAISAVLSPGGLLGSDVVMEASL